MGIRCEKRESNLKLEQLPEIQAGKKANEKHQSDNSCCIEPKLHRMKAMISKKLKGKRSKASLRKARSRQEQQSEKHGNSYTTNSNLERIIIGKIYYQHTTNQLGPLQSL